MKRFTFIKSFLLLCALIAGAGTAWADDKPNWSYTVVQGDASKLDTNNKTFTVDATHVWSYDVTVAAGTSPSITVGSASNTYGIKFGESSSKYYSPVILSTDAFNDKAVTKVSLYLKHNGKKTGSLTVKQGSITIGTAKTSQTSDWITVTCSETMKGTGGTLEIKYEVAQALYINKIEVWYEELGKGEVTTTTIDATGITNTAIASGTAAGTLKATVKAGGTTIDGAAVTWSSSDEGVAKISNTGVVTLVSAGTTTITADYAGVTDTYKPSSATYELTVTNSNANDGSLNKPFTVKEAIDFIKAKEYGDGNYYVKGIISKVQSTSVLSGGLLTYFISDDGTTTNQLQVFKGKNKGNTDFTAVSDIEVEDAVVVVGPLLYYNNTTPEINTGNYIYSITKKSTPTLVVDDVEMYVDQEKAVTDLYLIDDDYNGDITFSSSAESIAKVEGTVLKALAVGTATITVTAAATDKYKSAEETFEVTVKTKDVTPEGSNTGEYYELVTDASKLANGDKVLITSTGSYTASKVTYQYSWAMGAQDGTKRNVTDVVISNNTITSIPTDAQIVTLEGANGGKWCLGVGTNLYLNSGNKEVNTTSTKEEVSITIANGNATITAGDYTLQCNPNSGAGRFAYYSSTQKPIQLFKLVKSTSFDITVDADEWRTIVSAANATLPSGLKAYYVTEVENGTNGRKAVLTEATAIKANTPYLLNGAAGTYTLTVADEATAPTGNKLQISDETTSDGVYVLAKKSSGLGFYRWAGGKLGAGRVYLPATSDAPDFIGFDSTTTGLKNLTPAISTDEGAIYDLQGRKVAQPTKGLYIINGKKYVVK